MALTAGARLGSYVVTGRIGAGGMGEVYRAHDSRLRRDVALKVLPDAIRFDPVRLARFEQEAQALAALNHPGIAAIYGVEEGRVEGVPESMQALVLELVEGSTLATKIARGPLPIPEALEIARQIAEALEAAHSKGIIHRDLKPANIAITPHGIVKLLDFGLAKIGVPDTPGLAETVTVGATREGTVVGTAAYMSPEQATAQAVDKRTDIWAFGCVLYEMLTGRRVFDEDGAARILAAVLKSEPDWARLPAQTPPSVRRMLRRALRKDPRQRLGDIRDARLEIEDAKEQSEEDVPPVPAPRTRAVGLAATAVAVLLLVVLAIPAVRSWRAIPPAELRPDINTPSTLDPLHFALSPDGRHIVFVAAGDGPTRLWLRALNRTDARPLPGTNEASFPFWSPDSRSIGFFAHGKLHRIDISGGPPQPLANASAGRGGTWSADGTILFAPDNQGVLWRVPASGGQPTVVLPSDRKRGNGDRLPHLLPDGRRFLFYVTGGSEASGIYLGSLDGGEVKRLTPADSGGAYLHPDRILFVRAGTLLARRLNSERAELTGNPITIADSVGYDGNLNLAGFSVSAAGHIAYRSGGAERVQLTWFDRAGKATGTVGQPDIYGLQTPDLSPDGRLVALYRVVDNNPDIWLFDLIRHSMNRFTVDKANDINPAFSTSGTRIAFNSNRIADRHDIYVQPVSGPRAAERVVTTSNTKVPQDWSSGDRFLLYYENDPKTNRDLWAKDLTSKERPPFPVANTPYQETMAQFSRDARLVAYQTDESGRFEIVVQTFPEPARRWPISTAGGIAPRWSRTGDELFFIAPDGTLTAVRVITNGSHVEFGKPTALFKTRIKGGGTEGINKPNYAVAHDDHFLIAHVVESTPSAITLVLNWKP